MDNTRLEWHLLAYTRSVYDLVTHGFVIVEQHYETDGPKVTTLVRKAPNNMQFRQVQAYPDGGIKTFWAQL